MSDRIFMQECLRLARRGKGYVSPNPMVGAVLVQDGRILARGYHRKFGGPHAEVDCLSRFSGDVRRATLYVNLEPCSYHGKTPPCASLIVARGIGRVVAAMKDPNPRVAGRGLRILRRAGVRTAVGMMEAEARSLNRVFARHITARRPYVHVKIAQSRDGSIAGGRSRWISSLQSRKRVHAMRAEYDAVLVGAGTVRADNPSLTVRLVKGRNPDVVVLDGALSLPAGAKLLAPRNSRRVFLFTTTQALRQRTARANRLRSRGVTIIPLKGESGRFALHEVVSELYQRDVASILVEGGANVFTRFLTDGLVDEVTLFVSSEFFGTGVTAIEGGSVRSRRLAMAEKITVGKSGRDTTINILFKHMTS
ncbi:MAG: 5-amino-6-(5-phosphoribosylamino)uracil reductase / diaminohydroxyphosphoribosylaminopyrimidine [Bacteroidetes bacterium]|nr:5-amino-6-(5-phosphoribosylamino)uracil reductase / diaminohydroxyphosphoribosylaminopyrimidine [Bacteroidota bacterium]